MSKVLSIRIVPSDDVIILDIGNGTIVPFTFEEWGPTALEVKHHFSEEVKGNGENVYGVRVPVEVFQKEIDSQEGTIIYTAADGWLV
uniref:Uncharacterized protein n=2 Tax=unclassified bacterial viruses TaxID=12333 RepID=A0AAU6VXX8_9VIRU